MITRKGSIRTFVISAALALTAAMTPEVASAITDNGTLTSGSQTASCGGTRNFQFTGFSSTLPLGSYSPTGLTGGMTVTQLYGVFGIQCPKAGVLAVAGFGSNPSSSWLTSLTCNGTTKTSATASFSYAAGTASWQWTAPFPLPPPGPFTCSIVHN